VVEFDDFRLPLPPELPRVIGDDEAKQPVQKRGPEHQEDELRVCPTVEDVSKESKAEISRALRRLAERIVNNQRERQEIENEYL